MTDVPDDKMELQPDGSRTWRGRRFVQDDVGAFIMQPEPHRNPSSTPPPEMIEAGVEMLIAWLNRHEDDPAGDADAVRAIVTAALAARSNQEATTEITEEQVRQHHRYRNLWDDFQTVEKDLRDCALLIGHHYNSLRPVADALKERLVAKPVQEATRTVGDAEPGSYFKAMKAANDHISKLRSLLLKARHCIILKKRTYADVDVVQMIDDALSHTSSCVGP